MDQHLIKTKKLLRGHIRDMQPFSFILRIQNLYVIHHLLLVRMRFRSLAFIPILCCNVLLRLLLSYKGLLFKHHWNLGLMLLGVWRILILCIFLIGSKAKDALRIFKIFLLSLVVQLKHHDQIFLALQEHYQEFLSCW